jgi:molybdenum cofactor biosynthesis enzyme MoaA
MKHFQAAYMPADDNFGKRIQRLRVNRRGLLKVCALRDKSVNTPGFEVGSRHEIHRDFHSAVENRRSTAAAPRMI